MSLQDDLDFTAVTVATHALAAHLPQVPVQRLEAAAAAAVDAVRPFLDGTELARCLISGQGWLGIPPSGAVHRAMHSEEPDI